MHARMRIGWLFMLGLLATLAWLPGAAAQDDDDVEPGPAGESSDSDRAGDEDLPDRLRNVGVVGNPNTREIYERGLAALRTAVAAATPERRRIELGKAVEHLQQLLEDPDFRSHVILRHDRGLFTGAPLSAREALVRAGDEALAIYRELYDPRAEDHLRFARMNRRADLIEEVLLHFPYATAAVQAGLDAARLALEANDHPRAAALCERLLERDDLNETDAATLIAMAAECYAHDGRPWDAEQLLDLAAERYPTARVALGANWRNLLGVVRDLLATARANATRPDVRRTWSLPRGNLSQNRLIGDPADAARSRWQQTLPIEVETRDTQSFLLEYREYDAPRRHAVITDDLVIVPDRRRVMAYDLSNGRVRWQHVEPIRSGQFWRRSTDQGVIYTAAIDGDEIFVPQEVPLEYRLHNPEGVNGHRNRFQGWNDICVRIHAPRRKLVALDVATGNKRWEIGANRDDAERPIAETLSYPAAPIAAGRMLFCVGARVHDDNAHIYAVGLKRPQAAGEQPGVAWITRLATGQQETNLFGRPMREPTPSAPALGGHRMFVCTNLGLVVALDTLTGEQLWSVPYERTGYSKAVSFTPIFRANTFVPQPPLVVGHRVIVAPHDSGFVLCYDARTGELLWRLPHSLAGDRIGHVVGAADGRLWLVGRQRLAEVDITTGKLSRRPLDLAGGRSRRGAEFVVGRPAVTDDAIMVPLDYSIVVVDRRSLSIRRTIRTGLGSGPGNLVVADGVTVSVTEIRPTMAALSVAVTAERLRSSR